MLDGVSDETASKPEDAASEQSQLQLAALQANTADEGKTEAEKEDVQLETGDVDGKMNVEEEERYDTKVEEAVRDKSETEASGSGTDTSSTSTTTPTSTNATPQLASISGIAFADTSNDDSFSNETGALTALQYFLL